MTRKNYGFWERLEPVEGMVAVVFLAIGITSFLFFLSAFTFSAPKDFVGRLVMGAVGVFLAGGYIYQTAKLTKRR